MANLGLTLVVASSSGKMHTELRLNFWRAFSIDCDSVTRYFTAAYDTSHVQCQRRAYASSAQPGSMAGRLPWTLAELTRGPFAAARDGEEEVAGNGRDPTQLLKKPAQFKHFPHCAARGLEPSEPPVRLLGLPDQRLGIRRLQRPSLKRYTHQMLGQLKLSFFFQLGTNI